MKARLREAASGSLEQRLCWAALVATVAFGTFLRLNGYLGHQISFWLDEALWAPRFVDWPLLKLSIRPVGFVWLTRQIVALFGGSELAFRFLPNLGGVLSLWLMPYVASRVVTVRPLQVLLVALFALHPGLIDLSKEFKPYSFEVLVHVALLALYLRYRQTRSVGHFYAFLLALPVAFLLAYNAAFAFPGLLLLALFCAVKTRRRELVVTTLLCGALCAGVVYRVNSLSLAKIDKGGKTEAYWGKKYDLFYVPTSGESRIGWTLSAASDMAAVVGLRREMWGEDSPISPPLAERLGRGDRWFWITLTLVGVVAVLRKRGEGVLLWLLPLAVLVVVNALGKWPLGQFRTNLFACVYLFPLPVLAMEMLYLLGARLWGSALLALAGLNLLFGFALGVNWGNHKRIWCQDGYSREVLSSLYELRKAQLAEQPRARRARLVLDLYSAKAFDYYLKIHPTFSVRYRDFYKQFAVDNVGSNRLVASVERRLSDPGPVYAVAAKTTSVRALRTFAETRGRVLREKSIDDRVLILVADE